MERILKLIEEVNSQWSVVKDNSCSQSVVGKIWCKYERTEVVKKVKQTDRLQKTSKHQNRKCTTKQIKNK